MPKKNKSSTPSTRAVTVLMLTAVLGVAVLGYYVGFVPGAARVEDNLRRSEPTVAVQGTARNNESTPAQRQGGYRIPSVQGETLLLGRDAGTPPQGVSQEAHLVTETFKSIGIVDGRALAVQVDRDGTATVDLNRAVAQRGFGSMEESQMINALRLALGQFRPIQRILLRFEGGPVEFGHFDLSQPVDVIRGESTPIQEAPSEEPEE
jgi:hypothetical protein